MKKNILFCFCFFVSLSVFAQYPSFRIDYKFLVDEALLNMREEEMDDTQKMLAATAALALAFQDGDKPIAQVWVNKKFVRAKTNLYGDIYEINNKEDQQSIILYPENKEYFKSSTFNDKLLEIDDEYKLASDLPIKFDDKQTKEIAGYKCKLAVISVVDDEAVASIQVWYTDQIPKTYWGEYLYLKNIPGASLEVSTSGLGIQATKIEPEDDITIFSIPEDYVEIESPYEHEGLFSFGEYAEDELVQEYSLGGNLVASLDQETNLYDLVDDKGNVLSSLQFSSIGEFIDGMSIVTDENYNYGLIATDGKLLIPMDYSSLSYNSVDQTFIFSKADKFGVMKVDGQIIIPETYDYITQFNNEGNAIVIQGLFYGVINNKNKLLVPVKYSSITDISGDFFIAVEDDKYILYSFSGDKVASYDYIYLSNEKNIFIVLKDEKYGYIDEKGKIIIPIKFQYASIFEDGIAEVMLENSDETLYINTKGEIVHK